MSVRKLGRGLDVLISQPVASQEQTILRLDPKTIQANPSQPRKRFSLNELEELKASIAKEGVLQPIIVRDVGGRHEVVAGERRLRAAQEMGLPTIPAILLDVGDDRMLEVALVENLHRENLNPIEMGEAFQQLIKLKGWTQEELSQNLNFSRPAVTNFLRLLELPEDIQNAIARGQITMGHAKVLLSVTDPKEQRLLFEKIAEEKLSVRDLEEARSDTGASPARKAVRKRKAAEKSPQIQSLEDELGRAIGTRVAIRQGKGKGSISIEFYSPDDFERIRKLLIAGIN
jgi:ParB family transcriptional regulator, chromosome partitioning protein